MKKLVFALVCLLLVGLASAWYFLRGSDKARNILPADATAVAVFEPWTLARELGLTISDIKKLSSPDGRRWSHAINFLKPVYVFVSESGLSGVTVTVKDKDKLLEIICSYGYVSEEKDGYQWVSKGNNIGCIDDNKMLMCFLVTKPDAVQDEMARLMSQGRHKVPVLERAKKQKGAFRLCTSFVNLPKACTRYLPDDVNAPDVFLSAALRVAGQKITLLANVSETSIFLPLIPIEGNLIGMQPSEPFVWLCGGMKGEELLPLMRKVSLIRMALMGLTMFVDADLMIKAIDGDVTLVVPKADFRHPDFLFTATLSNTDFLKNADEWKGRAFVSVSRRGETDFLLAVSDSVKVFFGVREGHLYIASSEEMADMALQKAKTDAFQEASKGKYLSVSIDVNQLIEAYPVVATFLQSWPQARELTDAIERLSLSSDSPQGIELNVETNKPIKEIFLSTWRLVMGQTPYNSPSMGRIK